MHLLTKLGRKSPNNTSKAQPGLLWQVNASKAAIAKLRAEYERQRLKDTITAFCSPSGCTATAYPGTEQVITLSQDGAVIEVLIHALGWPEQIHPESIYSIRG